MPECGERQQPGLRGRVIALAYKRLPAGTATSELRSMSREDIESGLDFGGFAVFHCPLKPESEPALRILKDSSHQLVMITGDAPLTACHTAAQLHIVDRPVLVLQHRYASPCVPACSQLARQNAMLPVLAKIMDAAMPHL